MSKTELIHKAVKTLEKLPADKISEVNDFAEYILKKFEEDALQKGIQQLVAESSSFQFLAKEEEAVYTAKDLKEKYK